MVVDDLATASVLAGFEPPAVKHEGVLMREVRVVTVPMESLGEMRLVEVLYEWQGQFYTLSAQAWLLTGEEGVLNPIPLSNPELMIYSPVGEAVGDVEVVDLGGVEALCLERDFGSGYPMADCEWSMGDVQVRLNGHDLQSVVRLARSAVSP